MGGAVQMMTCLPLASVKIHSFYLPSVLSIGS